MTTKLLFLCCIFCMGFLPFFGQNGVNEIKVKDGSIKFVDFERIALTVEGEGWQTPSNSHKITYTFKAEELTTRQEITWDTRLPEREIWLGRGNWRITRIINVCRWNEDDCWVVDTVKSNALGFIWN